MHVTDYDHDYRHLASLGHNELTLKVFWSLVKCQHQLSCKISWCLEICACLIVLEFDDGRVSDTATVATGKYQRDLIMLLPNKAALSCGKSDDKRYTNL